MADLFSGALRIANTVLLLVIAVILALVLLSLRKAPVTLTDLQEGKVDGRRIPVVWVRGRSVNVTGAVDVTGTVDVDNYSSPLEVEVTNTVDVSGYVVCEH